MLNSFSKKSSFILINSSDSASFNFHPLYDFDLAHNVLFALSA
jgi:hypothetical protein